jgi:predicted O-methyltransferase YrrM
MKTEFYEKILPNQKKFSYLYNESDPIEKKIYELSEEISDKSTSLINNYNEISQEEMGSGVILLEYLKYIIKTNSYNNILEIGSFLGASAIEFASVISNEGSVTTIEKYNKFADIASKNIVRSNFNNINLIVDDAINTMSKFELNDEKFDFIFIDGDKSNYDLYLNKSLKLLKNGGTIIVDDIYFHGDSLNIIPKTEKGIGAKNCINLAKKLDKKKYSMIFLPISNGLLQITHI